MELTKKHINILKRAESRDLFFGECDEIKDLCGLGLMYYVGIRYFNKKPYFRLMAKGRDVLKDLKQVKAIRQA